MGQIGDRNLILNLRARWTDELAPYSDEAIVKLYYQFSGSSDYGNNDKNFPEWFSLLPEIEAEIQSAKREGK